MSGDLVEASTQTLAGAVRGHQAVVMTAGAGASPDLVTAVDERGAITAIDAATLAGVRRFVLVSVFMDAWRAADVHLSGTDLDWLIIRPGTLTDDAGTGHVNAGVAIPYGDVPRADVAAVIAHAVLAPTPRPPGHRGHDPRPEHRECAVPPRARTSATGLLSGS